MVKVVQIPVEHVDEVWPLAAPMLQKAIDRGGEVPLNRMLASILKKERQLWFIWSEKLEGVLVTELYETAQGRVANLVSLGGAGMKHWLHLIDTIEKWARSQDCVGMEIIGRKGWARALPDYHVTRYVLNKWF